MNITPITLKFKNEDIAYTLEFSRATVAEAERAGFDPEKVDSMPMTMVPMLFFYAFKMHHPSISRKKTDTILFDELKGLNTDMANRLVDLYNAPFETLFNSEEDEESKNPNLEVIL